MIRLFQQPRTSDLFNHFDIRHECDGQAELPISVLLSLRLSCIVSAWRVDSCWPMEPYIRWRPRSSHFWEGHVQAHCMYRYYGRGVSAEKFLHSSAAGAACTLLALRYNTRSRRTTLCCEGGDAALCQITSNTCYSLKLPLNECY